jgi:succinyl-diaminopimelate desuccinylase
MSSNGKPFLTPAGRLVDAARSAIRAELGLDTRLSTEGGTSDGRFIAPTGAEVVEFGPRNATIHQIDECVAVADLAALARTYRRVLDYLLA